ncbi:hypothetical protein FRB96_000938 [Tulasnella sp. 330]|nr:hypothetical protein FRB96_000938 [Tulasnella sp. 330]
MHLLDLPTEVLLLILSYFETFRDLYCLAITCRTSFSVVSFPGHILHLAHSSTEFQPYPHLLLATKSRSLADWAVSEISHRAQLLNAIEGGCEAVLQLGLEKSPLTFEDLCNIHRTRINVIDPLSEALYPQCRPEARTDDVMLALINFWIYCDLFHHTISSSYSILTVAPLSNETRLAWLRFCIPDAVCNPQYKVVRPYPTQQQSLTEVIRHVWRDVCERLTGKDNPKPAWVGWWVRCALHAGIPTLSLINSKDAKAIPPEIKAVEEQARQMIQGGVEPDVVEYTFKAETGSWLSLYRDIMWSQSLAHEMEKRSIIM